MLPSKKRRRVHSAIRVSKLELLAGQLIKNEAEDARHLFEHFWQEVGKKIEKGFSNYEAVGYLLAFQFLIPMAPRRLKCLFDGWMVSKREIKTTQPINTGGLVAHLPERHVVVRSAPTIYDVLVLFPEGKAIMPSSVSLGRFVLAGAVGVLSKVEFNEENFPAAIKVLLGMGKPPLVYSLAVATKDMGVGVEEAAKTANEIAVLILASLTRGPHRFVYVMVPGRPGDGISVRLQIAPDRWVLGRFGWVGKSAITLKSCPSVRYEGRECVLTGETLPSKAKFTARPIEVMLSSGVVQL
jgi:hypothetical protein